MKTSKGVALERKEIRLQFTGYVLFAAKLLSVATGLIFQFMIARSPNTSNLDWDLWFNINDVLAYFTLLAGVVPFWVMRCVSRGKQGATKTGLATNLIISAISTIIYLSIVPFVLSGLGISLNYLPLYFIVAFQIVELYLIGLFESCLQAISPQTVGYGLLVQQVFKVILGYVLIIQLGQPLMGAVIAIVIAFALQVGYYFKLLGAEIKQRIQWGYVKDWLKGSIANIYSVVGNQLAAVVFLLLFSLGGEGSRGIYGSALQIANVITYSSFLSFALYPKLLAEGKSGDVTQSLKTVLMFAMPMTVCAVALANSYIIILREEIVAFSGAGLVLVVLALDAFVGVLSGIYGSVIFGAETLDQEKISFRKLVRSKLFLAFSLTYVHSAITIPTTYFILTTYAFQQPLLAAFSVCVVNSIVRFGMFLILVVMARGVMKITIPWRSIGKYSLASAVMGVVLFLLPYSSTISTTLVWTAVGGGVYIGVLLLIDKETRSLPKEVLKEIRKTKSPPPSPEVKQS